MFGSVRFAAIGLALVPFSSAAFAAPLTQAAIEKAPWHALAAKPKHAPDPMVFKAEILLDRAHVSPGVIDGVDGDNFRKAVRIFASSNNLDDKAPLSESAWTKLTSDTAPLFSSYELSEADVKGPYVKKIPAKFEQMSRLKRLGYRSIKEMLGEKFHIDAQALVALNPKARFRNEGESLTVPSVDVPGPAPKVARIVVDKKDSEVQGYDSTNKLVASYPASIGSTEKPAPSGQFEIKRIVHNPDYTYDPAYAFKGVKAKQPFTIAPGPNNPVGLVWMDLSFEGYGIHGTPDPSAIGKTQSHGCVRLTNWDAVDLASMAGKGTTVSFQDGP